MNDLEKLAVSTLLLRLADARRLAQPYRVTLGNLEEQRAERKAQRDAADRELDKSIEEVRRLIAK